MVTWTECGGVITRDKDPLSSVLRAIILTSDHRVFKANRHIFNQINAMFYNILF